VRSNIRQVIEAFARGHKAPRSSGRFYARGDKRKTCSTDGNPIYSYAEPIAVRLSGKTVLILDRWGTLTTDSQIHACKCELPRLGFRVVVVPDLYDAIKSYRSVSALPHGRCEFSDHCVELVPEDERCSK